MIVRVSRQPIRILHKDGTDAFVLADAKQEILKAWAAHVGRAPARITVHAVFREPVDAAVLDGPLAKPELGLERMTLVARLLVGRNSAID
ncbi:MAG TPA: hypothetical protein VMA75_04970 [Candidatus Paceibacterota bacterium]|nr:hypothetical protein [Candidatus Paceibacterota bacterium]